LEAASRVRGRRADALSAPSWRSAAQRSVSPEENKTEKEKTYELTQRFLREFAARNGSTACKDLLGCEISTAEGMKYARENKLFQTRCVKLVRDAIDIAG
jgi:C_GCAxxG_C_C family probable redox protein